jgi:hypothetical protein
VPRKTGNARVDPYVGTAAGSDWPAGTLSRIPRRGETVGSGSLAGAKRHPAAPDADLPHDDFGWEEAVREKLRKRQFEAE